jgi:hypothetical protein
MKTLVNIIAAMFLLSGTAMAEGQVGEDVATFEFLTKLKGDWVLSPADQQEGKTTKHKLVAPLVGNGKVAMNFKALGKNSTIQETLLPGNKKEMATMYHCDNYKNCTRVVSKHYCAKRNQPELLSAQNIVQDTVSFSCDMSTELCNSNEGHVHKISHELSNDDRHLKTTYTINKNGKFKKNSIYHFDRAS